MSTDLHEVLADLFAVSNRLTRIAANAAGGRESPAVWRTLSVLVSTGAIRLGELAELSRISQPTATKLVDSLASRGWVERAADPDDARASVTRITNEGRAALAAWRNELATAMVPLFEELPESDRRALERAVAVIGERVAASERTIPRERGKSE